jgi:hypothetical protein
MFTIGYDLARKVAMPHDSILPGENNSTNVRFDKTGISLSWRTWKVAMGFLIATILGSGSFVGFQFVTSAQMIEALATSEKKQETKSEEKIAPVRAAVGSITVQLGDITDKLSSVQLSQIQQNARQEARRITADIKNRSCREKEYDRLRALNEKRLVRGDEPCSTIECSN